MRGGYVPHPVSAGRAGNGSLPLCGRDRRRLRIHRREGRRITRLDFGQVRCRSNRWDIYKVSDSHTVSVLKGGSGAGSVSSDPAGINCGSACAAIFHGGTLVTLTATPDAGSVLLERPGLRVESDLRGDGRRRRLPHGDVRSVALMRDPDREPREGAWKAPSRRGRSVAAA